MIQTKEYGVVGLVYNRGKWQLSFGISTEGVCTSSYCFANTEDGFSEIIGRIDKFLHQHSLIWYRVLLLYSPPDSTQLFPILYVKYNPVIVVHPKRLKLHEQRLEHQYENKSKMLVEAAISGLTTDLLLIETTNACTFRCLFCPQDTVTREKVRMPFEIANQIVKEYAATGLGGIAFHLMGEPTSNPYLPDLVKLVVQLGIDHTLTTNASTLTRDISLALLKNGLMRTQISMQTANKEQFYSYKRPAPKYTYEAVLENIKIFIQTKWQYAPDSEIEIHVMDNSLYQPRGVKSVISDKEAVEVVQFWGKFLSSAAEEIGKIDILRQINESTRVTLAREKWDYVNFKFEPTISLKFKMAGHWIQNFLEEDEIIIKAEQGTCQQIAFGGYNQIAILADGDAVMCCFDYDGKTAIGNIHDNSLSEIDQKANYIRNRLINSSGLPFEICKRCLGLRVKCFSMGAFYVSSPQNEINLHNVAVYGNTPISHSALGNLSHIGIPKLSLIQEDIVSNDGSNTNDNLYLSQNIVYKIQNIDDKVEAVVFPAEWNISEEIIKKLIQQYPNKIIGQIDIVALNTFARKRILAVKGLPQRDTKNVQEETMVDAGYKQTFWAKQYRKIKEKLI